MINPRPCNQCGKDVEPDRLAHVVFINAHIRTPDYQEPLCPACARRTHRARRFGSIERWARDTARTILEHSWGEPLQTLWLQQDQHRWSLIVRRKAGNRIHPTEAVPC